jgi:hypothetical protein
LVYFNTAIITLENLFTASLFIIDSQSTLKKAKFIIVISTEQKKCKTARPCAKLCQKKITSISQTNKRRDLKYFPKRKLLWKLTKKMSQIHGRGKSRDST